VNLPITGFRPVISIITIITGMATTPLITAVQYNALIGSIGLRLSAMSSTPTVARGVLGSKRSPIDFGATEIAGLSPIAWSSRLIRGSELQHWEIRSRHSDPAGSQNQNNNESHDHEPTRDCNPKVLGFSVHVAPPFFDRELTTEAANPRYEQEFKFPNAVNELLLVSVKLLQVPSNMGKQKNEWLTMIAEARRPSMVVWAGQRSVDPIADPADPVDAVAPYSPWVSRFSAQPCGAASSEVGPTVGPPRRNFG
jgi:hypothetical protein